MNRKIVIPLLALLIGLAPALAAAQERQDEPAPPIERLKQDLKGIANNITNAKMRMRQRMSGMSGGSDEAPAKPPTPAEACCRSNIERINKKIELMTRRLEQLYVYYTERRDSEALLVVDTIQAELHAISRGVAIFQMEGSKDSAQQALSGLLRPFNRLRKAIDELAACCAVDPALWSEPAAGPPQP
jgi:hypothetical protein